ncbi:hypothetical protein MMC29_008080 [Sticta canariensis]|nr:hypothetical protein [Sticta canariensis]
MPGAGKKRGKIDKKNQRPAAQGETPPVGQVGQASGGYDGAPSGPQSGASSGGGRGRQESTPGQPARSASREPREPREQSAGPQLLRDPARDYPMVLNRNVDFPGNAYNLISQVSYTKR